jgi:transcriptional regulator GlxA family with amidase domain
MQDERTPLLAQVVVFDGFDPLDVIAPYEVLWAGGRVAAGALRVELAALDAPREVASGSPGISLTATAAIDAARADILVVPGAVGPIAGDGPDTIPALIARAAESALPAAIAPAFARPGAIVATVCGGALILGMAGLLDGRRAVTHHLAMDVLAATGAIAVPARVVDDGNLVSGGAVTSGLDVGLHLLERVLGPRIAHAVEAMFAHERRGTVWRAVGPEAVSL